MTRRATALLFAAAAGVYAVAGCTGDTGPEGPMGPEGPEGPQGPPGVTTEVFVATLTGGAEVPANNSTGTGTAVITSVGGQLLFRVDVGNLQNVTRAHIHGPAGTTANGPIRVNLYEPPAGTTPLNFTTTATLASGVAPLPSGISGDSLLVIMRNGNAYVNVHTSQIPAGEIRGQIQLVP